MKEKNRPVLKTVINIIIVITILGFMIFLIIEEHNDKKVKNKQKISSYTTQNISITENVNILKNQLVEGEVHQKQIIQKQYKGYDVSAKLEIPAIDLQTYILQKYSIQALNVCVTKFWGADANQKGNFCIAGHNFKNKNMFHNLKKLKLGDRLFIIDNNVGKIEYEIYDIYQVFPEDISCLSQETNGIREVTLITCTNNSEKRIIVKAREWEG